FAAALCLVAAAAAGADTPGAPRGGELLLAQQSAPAPVERLRRIPEQAREGVMLPPEGRFVIIDRDRFTLAPGALIRDLNNRIVLPDYVRKPAKVRYTLDSKRQISQIWIVAEQP
ncbi:MAG: hypothetical protein R3286_01710, partial [Gammaproteobacteria bacterium]|nr:hypothetical protein [Gammaproteobacteria bacterium]